MIPIFVGGTGRCGTTVLRRALGAHPDVTTLRGEFRIISDPDGLLDLYHNLTHRWTPGRANRALHRFEELVRNRAAPVGHKYNLGAWCGSAHWLEKRLQALMKALVRHRTPARGKAGAAFYESGPWNENRVGALLGLFVYNYYERINAEATAFVDDTPDLGALTDEVRFLFPEALIVHMIRDPFDVLASFREVYYSGRWTSDNLAANAWRIAGMLDRCDAQRPDLTIRLEDLVDDPPGVLRVVCEEAGLDYCDEMAAHVNEGLAHLGRWREELSEEDMPIAEKILGNRRKALGYWEEEG